MLLPLAGLLAAQLARAELSPSDKTIPTTVTPAAPTTGTGDPAIDAILGQIDQAKDAGLGDKQEARDLQDKRDLESRQRLSQVQQDYDQQTRRIEDAGSSHPQNGPINSKAGDALLALGEPQRSLPLLDRAIDVSAAKGDKATLGHALFSRAGANVALKDYPAVVADMKRVLALDPNNQQAQTLISLYQGRAAGHGGGDIQTGMQPGSQEARQLEAYATQSGQAPSPFGQLGAPNAQTAAQLEAARLVKLAAEKSGLDAHAARSFLNQALAADPRNVPALLARARIERQASAFSATLADADKAAQLSPRTAEAYYLRAEAKKGLGFTTPDVAADYATARELDPTLTGAEVSALASGGGAAAGSSSLAEEAARARHKAIYRAGWFDSTLQSVPPQYHEPLVIGVSLLFMALISLALAAFLRRTR